MTNCHFFISREAKHQLVTGAVILCWTLCSQIAFGQADVERFERQLEQIRRDTRMRINESIPPGQRSMFDYGAFTTFNFMTLDDPSLLNHTLRQTDLTAFARLNVDGVHEVFLRGRAFYRDFNEGDSFDTEVNGWDGRVERAFYQFNLGRYLASSSGEVPEGDLTVKLGRDLVYWANGLVLSIELDGVMVNASYGDLAVEFLAGRTPSDTVDIDSSRPNFDDHTNRFFYGGMLSVRAGTHRPYIYALGQRDHNSDDTSVNNVNGTDVTTVYDYDSYYIGAGSVGALTDRLAYGIEAVFEGGRTKSNSAAVDGDGNFIPQTTDDIHAWALDAQLNYLFPDPQRTRLSGEVILASGDDDRQITSSTFGGNQPGTRDTAFNAFGLLNTGLAFAPTVSNIIVARGGISLFPFPEVKPLQRLQIGSDLFAFFKLDANAPIDEATTDDSFLGFEPDVFLNWQITSDVTLALRYGAFVPGDAIVNDGKIRQFFYAGVTFAF